MNYHDLEIRVGQQQAGSYPVELTLDNTQEFGERLSQSLTALAQALPRCSAAVAARHPAPGKAAVPSVGAAGGGCRERVDPRVRPGGVLSRWCGAGRAGRPQAWAPAGGRQGGTGVHAVGGKDSREKWLCISYTPRCPARSPKAR